MNRSLPTQVALLAFLVLLFFAPFLLTKAAWSGRKTLPVEVRIVDASSGRPIVGATVCVGVGDADRGWRKARWDEGQPPQCAATTDSGETTFDTSFPAGGTDYLWNHAGSVVFTATCVEASAPGYTTRALPLTALVGRGRDLHDDSPVRLSLALEKLETDPSVKP
jgi:hypothetical protein